MKTQLGQVVSAIAAATLLVGWAAAAHAGDIDPNHPAVKTAEAFLAALDRKDVSASNALLGPNAANARVGNLMQQRSKVPTGGYWRKGRTLNGLQQTSRNTYLVTFQTTYANATKLQRLMVQCNGSCVVSAFEETAQ